MIKKVFTSAIAASLLAVSAVSLAVEDAPAVATPAPAPSLNPMNPATLQGLLNPATHKPYHLAMMNPAQWGQFVQPQFYMQMANPQVMAQWMNPATFQAMMNPQTMMHWMQPNVMMGEMSSFQPSTYANPASYQQFFNPATFMSWMNPATYSGAAAQISSSTAGSQGFDMGSWTNMFQPAPQVKTEKDEG